MPTQQMNNAVQFSPHNPPHHTRLIAPQGLNMVPGMTYTTAAPDPAAMQQIYSSKLYSYNNI